jgi:hypothetical protein
MNAIFPRFIKSAYRKEPISSFIVIVGAIDAVIGGVGGRWSLLSFGFLLLLTGALVRWRQTQKAQTVIAENPSRHLLPPSPSATPLPMLMSKKNKPNRQ